MENELCALAETADQHWRLAVVQDGVGLRNKRDSLFSNWVGLRRSCSLSAGGPAPYTLAFGSGRLGREEEPVGADMIQQALALEDQKIRIRPAVLGKRLELGGENAFCWIGRRHCPGKNGYSGPPWGRG